MGFGKTSLIAVAVALIVLLGEFFLIFNGAASPADALLGMAITTVNGVIMAFSILLLLIGIMLSAN